MISVFPFAWEDVTFLTRNALRTASFTCASHIPQAIPSTSNMIFTIMIPPQSLAIHTAIRIPSRKIAVAAFPGAVLFRHIRRISTKIRSSRMAAAET